MHIQKQGEPARKQANKQPSRREASKKYFEPKIADRQASKCARKIGPRQACREGPWGSLGGPGWVPGGPAGSLRVPGGVPEPKDGWKIAPMTQVGTNLGQIWANLGPA